jgi:predicted TPR repeat methyltransferase
MHEPTTQETALTEPAQVPVEEALRVALALHRSGDLADAEKLYRRILEGCPEQPETLHFLGILVRQQNRRGEAIDLMQRAIAAAPGYVSAHNNLGNLFSEDGRFEEARDCVLRALELSRDDPLAINNLGIIEGALGNAEKAREAFERAAALAPDFALPYENLGRYYYRLGNIARAHDYFCHAVLHDPGLCHSRQFMGIALAHLGKLEEARAYYRKWIETEPDNPVPQHLLSTVSVEAAPLRASNEYVRRVFDSFASTFNVHLQRLEYRAPELVTEALREDGLRPGDGLDILDAGCGTGLCGALLRPFASKLHGVDLSPGMLEKARADGQYDALTEGELTAFMDGYPQHYDVIACADTLCYFGDLNAVVKAAGAALRVGGRFAFSVERTSPDGTPAGFCLRHSGRYAHTEDYVRGILSQAGLQVRSMKQQILRMESGTPVEGLIVAAMKPTGA